MYASHGSLSRNKLRQVGICLKLSGHTAAGTDAPVLLSSFHCSERAAWTAKKPSRQFIRMPLSERIKAKYTLS